MAKARIFRPENRLASIAGRAQDSTAEALEKRATENLVSIGDDIREYATQQLEIVERLAAEREEIIFAECRTMSDAALAIAEVAGAGGLDSLGLAARGLRSMVESLFFQGVWHTDALKLHVEALSMFAADPNLSQDEVNKVVGRLKAMRDLIGVID